MKNIGRILAPIIAASLLPALGCREDADSPTGPESAPAFSTASAPALSFRQISAGLNHTCGVTTGDRAYCWGYTRWGQVGNGRTDGPETCNTHPCSTRPIAVLGGLRFEHVSAGAEFNCGVTTDNRVYCWGRNEEGQLGDGTQTLRLRPVAVAGMRRFRQVRAGGSHACAIDMTNAAFCWGNNTWAQLGNGAGAGRETRPVAVKGGLLWRQLSGGHFHTCGVTTGDKAYCWGRNFRGELGDGSTTRRLKPTAVSGGLLFRQIDAGFDHTCAVAVTAFRGYCWGGNEGGQLGDGTTVRRLTPTPVFGSRRFDNVAAGQHHTCGVTRTQRGVCWGSNAIGNGTRSGRTVPTAVSGNLQLRQASAGTGFSCGVTSENRGYCWGANFTGELGDGSSTTRLTPVAVVGPL